MSAKLALKQSAHVAGGVHVSVHSHTTAAIVRAMEYTVNFLSSYFAIPTQSLGVLILEFALALEVDFARAILGDRYHCAVASELSFEDLHWTG